ncbi:MAG: response regulator transcription factor [Syntrophobacteraceae bacterium]
MSHLLVIDDDTKFCELLSEYLEPEGFELTLVHDGTAGLREALAKTEKYDLIILDLMLPGMSGFEVLRGLRAEMDTPVLMLTGRDQEVDRIVGLEIGADDFILKPCNPRELVARVRAILRRIGIRPVEHRHTNLKGFVVGDLALDAGARVVRRNGEELYLTTAEFNLLQMLLGAAGHIVSRAELAASGLGRPLTAYDRSVDIHLSRLRKKLGPERGGVERIKTVRGVGYLYALPHGGARGDLAKPA